MLRRTARPTSVLSLALVALACSVSFAPLARAQSTIIERAQQGAPSQPPPPPGELSAPAASSNAEEDAGVQRIAEPRRLPFKVSATLDEQLYSTSNVFLEGPDAAGSPEHALVLASTLALRVDGLAQRVGRGLLTPSVGFTYQRYLHGLFTTDRDIESLDYDSFSLPLAASYRFGQGWEATASFTAGAVYTIRGDPSYEVIYRSYTPSLGLRKIAELRPGTLFVAGGSVSYADTWTTLRDLGAFLAYRDDRNDKLDYALDAALYRLVGPWTLAASARVSVSDYLHWEEAGFGVGSSDHRLDLNVNLGFSASYAFREWGSLRAFLGYDLRESDSGAVDYDYTSRSLGAGLSLSVRY